MHSVTVGEGPTRRKIGTPDLNLLQTLATRSGLAASRTGESNTSHVSVSGRGRSPKLTRESSWTHQQKGQPMAVQVDRVSFLAFR